MKRFLDFRSPYTCMAIVLSMYLVKVVAKIYVGQSIHSMGLLADGVHNLSDMVEAAMILYVLHLSKLGETDDYPIGLSAIEPVVVGLIGVMLFGVGLRFLFNALLGLTAWAGLVPGVLSWLTEALSIHPPEPISIGEGGLMPVVVLLGCSIMLSWIVSTYQIALGRSLGHASLVADGRETRSDSLVESSVLVGVLAGAFLGWPWIDPAAALVVSLLLFRTAREMLSDSLAILLNRTASREITEPVTQILSSVNEIRGYDQEGDDRIKIFHLAKRLLANIKVYVPPMLPNEGFYEVKKALRRLVSRAIGNAESLILIRPSMQRVEGERLLLPLLSLEQDDVVDGVLAEQPEEAATWVLVHSLGGAARAIRKVEPPGVGETLQAYSKRLGATRIVLSDSESPSGDVEAGCVRLPFLTVRDLFH